MVPPILSDLTASFTESYNLIKLNDITSRPNYKMVSFNNYQPIDADISEYFQYIVVIKNAGATEPLGN